ncbi:MAG: HDOD domain-containing protein [Agitococcus sp.]|nr:HDOD domain-containing protein [Agitococcus sp.]
MVQQPDLTLLSREAVRAIRCMGIPSKPDILIKLTRELDNDNPNYIVIGKLVESDVALSAAILKTVNSALYGLRRKIPSINQAMTMLGLRTVAQILTGLLLQQALTAMSKEGPSMDKFWDNSATIASISALLAQKLRICPADEAYTFGLFQDCGIPLMMGCHTDYQKILTVANVSMDKIFTEVEDESFTLNHSAVGFALADSWGLPEYMSQAILHHHNFQLLASDSTCVPAQSKQLICVTLLAERVLQLHTKRAQTVEWPKGQEFAFRMANLDEGKFEALASEVSEVLGAE